MNSISNKNKKYTGSGIFIIEKRDDTNYIILFSNSSNGNLEDLGGLKDKGENIFQTAQRETMEESRNMFNIDINTIKNKSFPIFMWEYVSFVICINKIDENVYYSNINNTDDCSHHWKETDNIVRIPIDNIIKNSTTISDINGKTWTLRGRTRGILKRLVDNMPYITKLEPITLTKRKYMGNIKCLSNTITYTTDIANTKKGGYYISYKNYKYKYMGLKHKNNILKNNI